MPNVNKPLLHQDQSPNNALEFLSEMGQAVFGQGAANGGLQPDSSPWIFESVDGEGAYARRTGGGGRPGGGGSGGITPFTPATYITGATNVPDDQEFNINVIFGEAGWSDNQLALIRSAADIWSRVITRDIEDVGSIDDIAITVNLTDIDGKGSRLFGNVLAEAFTDGNRAAGTGNEFLPYSSHINFDVYDFADGMRTNSDFLGLIMHEVGHALGFIDQTFSLFGNTLLNSNDDFIGSNAVTAYNNGSFVPLDSAGDHWDNYAFSPSGTSMQNELMTGVQVKGETVLLSDITLGAFVDLGYAINTNLMNDTITAYSLDSLSVSLGA